MARLYNNFHLNPSTANEGYIILKYTGEFIKKYKVSIRCGDNVVEYPLVNPEIKVPIDLGSGSYVFILYEQITGNKYKPISTLIHRFNI